MVIGMGAIGFASGRPASRRTSSPSSWPWAR
jgi:hypothetical protein